MRKATQKIVNELKDYPLTDDDILRLQPNAKIVQYSNLYKYKDIHDLLYPKPICFILYETKPNFGHWTVVTLYDQVISFFDSYGGAVDTQLDYIPKEFAKVSHQDYPYLSKLLYESPYPVINNPYQFQKMGPHIKDCGKWACLRSRLRELSIEDFAFLFKGKDSDDVCVFLTEFMK